MAEEFVFPSSLGMGDEGPTFPGGIGQFALFVVIIFLLAGTVGFGLTYWIVQNIKNSMTNETTVCTTTPNAPNGANNSVDQGNVTATATMNGVTLNAGALVFADSGSDTTLPSGVTLTNPGSGYTPGAHAVTFTSDDTPPTSAATAVAYANPDGQIVGIQINGVGSGYSTPPTAINISSPP